MQEEMLIAARKLGPGDMQWRDALEESDFFYRHKNFIQVSIIASNSNDFMTWHRFCESRLRLLIAALETPHVMVWPFARFFKRRFTKHGYVQSKKQQSNESCRHECFFYMALRFAPGMQGVDLRYQISDFAYNMNSWDERKDGMDLSICNLSQNELPTFVFARQGVHQVHSWVREPGATVAPAPKRETGDNPKDENQDESDTKLTPKMARSTLADGEIDLYSPTKKAKRKY
jgi:poly(A) polymerase Pap1